MKKIFINHSSIDKDIVDVFIDKILRLGLNIDTKDIACTSREDTGVKTGEDIRNFIKENISNCDFVLFMVSENYQNSQICPNEMGAAWATDRTVIPLIFPNVGFDTIGWLYNVRKGIKLNDLVALDTLFEGISEKFEHKLKVSTWNKQKDDFVKNINSFFNQYERNLPVIIEDSKEEQELDYREIFDNNMNMCQKSLQTITTAVNNNTTTTNKTTRILSNITENKNASPSRLRPVFLKASNETQILADICMVESSNLKNNLDETIECAIKMKSLIEIENDDIEDENQSIKSLIESMKDFMEAVIEAKSIYERDKTNMDKTYSISRKKLIKSFSELIGILEFNIDRANELLWEHCSPYFFRSISRRFSIFFFAKKP